MPNVAIVILLLSGVAMADDDLLDIPSDAQATYTVVQKAGTKKNPTLTTKRVDSNGESYSKRIFDCEKQITKYLGDGETLKEMKESMPEKKMYAVVVASIAWYQYKYVCK